MNNYHKNRMQKIAGLRTMILEAEDLEDAGINYNPAQNYVQPYGQVSTDMAQPISEDAQQYSLMPSLKVASQDFIDAVGEDLVAMVNDGQDPEFIKELIMMGVADAFRKAFEGDLEGEEELQEAEEDIEDEDYPSEPQGFDFEDYDDTDLAGSGVEMSIDELIRDYQDRIESEIPDMRDHSAARIAIKKLWKQKIDGWKGQVSEKEDSEPTIEESEGTPDSELTWSV